MVGLLSLLIAVTEHITRSNKKGDVSIGLWFEGIQSFLAREDTEPSSKWEQRVVGSTEAELESEEPAGIQPGL